MNTARKLALLATTALAAMALAATNAAATNSVTVNNEDTGNPCDFALGNCQIHAVGEAAIFNEDHTVFSSCEDEFEGKIGADGTGHITVINNANHHDPETEDPCVTQNCTGNPEGANEDEWPLTGTEETGPHEGTMAMRFCVEHASFPNLSGEHCEPPLHVTEPTENGHHYVLAIEPEFQCPNGRQISGSWDIEGPDSATHDDIEIIH